jgi:hypothetical protein
MNKEIKYRITSDTYSNKYILLEGYIQIEPTQSYIYEQYSSLSRLYYSPKIQYFTNPSLIFTPSLDKRRQLEENLSLLFENNKVLLVNDRVILEEKDVGIFTISIKISYSNLTLSIVKELINQKEEIRTLRLLKAIEPFKCI